MAISLDLSTGRTSNFRQVSQILWASVSLWYNEVVILAASEDCHER